MGRFKHMAAMPRAMPNTQIQINKFAAGFSGQTYRNATGFKTKARIVPKPNPITNSPNDVQQAKIVPTTTHVPNDDQYTMVHLFSSESEMAATKMAHMTTEAANPQMTNMENGSRA
jgi:hypothetical protein